MFNYRIQDIKYFRERISRWGRVNNFDYPWRSTSNFFHSLTAEMMLQRTRADQVIPIYLDFVNRFQTPKDFVDSIKASNENVFSTLGLAWRNQVLIKAAEYLMLNDLPASKKELQNIPGVGKYITAALLSFQLGKREALIDSNVVRLYGRFFGFKYNNETRRKAWLIKLGNLVTPFNRVGKFNYSLLDFSMNVCKSRPQCSACPVKRKCNYFLVMNKKVE